MIIIDPIKRPPKKSSAIDKDELMKEIDLKFSDLVGGAPETLDTLKELADALGNNPDLLLHFKNKEKFEEELVNGNILDTSIVFILDTKEIYTHGLFYDGSKVDLSNIEESLESIRALAETSTIGKGTGTNSSLQVNAAGCEATGANSFAAGNYTKASGDCSVAIGRGNSATGRAAVALGGTIKGFKFTGSAGSLIYDTNIDNIYILIISGINLVTPSDYATVVATIQSAEVGTEGLKVTLDKTLSADSDLNESDFGVVACVASGTSSVALGQSFLASGASAQAEGNGTVAAGTNSHAEGQYSIASGTVSHAEGLYTTASSDNAHAEGGYTVASNYEAHAEGWHTVASGEDSHVEGIRSIASGRGSHAEGGYNDASGTYSHAEGNGVAAKGACSHAEGSGLGTIHLTGNNGVYTVTGGYNFQNTFDLNDLVGAYIYKNLTNLYENYAKISKIELENEYTLKVTLDTNLGELNKTNCYMFYQDASGSYSHSENMLNAARGNSSHAGGARSSATGLYAFVHGELSKAAGQTSTSFGVNNYTLNHGEFTLGISNLSHKGDTTESQTLFSIGCGDFVETSSQKKLEQQIPYYTPEDGSNAIEVMRNGDVWLGNYNEGVKIYDGVTKTSDLANKEEIPTKISLLENDSNYILNNLTDGVYAVAANEELIDPTTADESCIGVAIIAGNHQFMIEKNGETNAAYGSQTSLHWSSTDNLSIVDHQTADGTNVSGYLPKPDGTFLNNPHLSDDFTTWTSGALSEFNEQGKSNSSFLNAGYTKVDYIRTVLDTFNNATDLNFGKSDWYVPACGQLALIYLVKDEINAILTLIGGTILADSYYWSSSEYGANDLAWFINFSYGLVALASMGFSCKARFVRDIQVKPIKQRISDLESKVTELDLTVYATTDKLDKKAEGSIEALDNGNIKVTINGVSKDFMPATPSGDPMHHYYESLGAQWNDGEDKTLQIPIYGKDFNTTEYFPVVHKSKRWYFNLLGDITNAQMAEIVSYPRTIFGVNAYANCKARTIVYDGTGTSSSTSCDYFGAKSNIESLYTISAIYPTSSRNLFYQAYSIKYILGLPGTNRGYFIGYYGIDSIYSGCFISLVEIRIISARKDIKFQSSPNLSKTSILFMVNEADPTTAITITLHPTAYARIANDEEVIAALEAKNAALQGTGGSVSIVSA